MDFEEYFRVERVDSSPASGRLYIFYRQIQQALGHKDFPSLEPEKQDLLQRFRIQTLRLRYYSNVAKNFQTTHNERLQQAYKLVRRPLVDFSKLSRLDAMTEIEVFSQASISIQHPTVTIVRNLLYGLKSLSPTTIPSSWTTGHNQ